MLSDGLTQAVFCLEWWSGLGERNSLRDVSPYCCAEEGCVIQYRVVKY